jgi:hypothetical protein
VEREVQSEALEHTLKLTGQPLIPMISSPDHQEQHGTRIENDGSPELGGNRSVFPVPSCPGAVNNNAKAERQAMAKPAKPATLMRSTNPIGDRASSRSIKSRQSPRLNFFR